MRTLDRDSRLYRRAVFHPRRGVPVIASRDRGASLLIGTKGEPLLRRELDRRAKAASDGAAARATDAAVLPPCKRSAVRRALLIGVPLELRELDGDAATGMDVSTAGRL